MAITETQNGAQLPDDMDLAGRVARGTRGIGAAICRSLAGRGAGVAAGFGHDGNSYEILRVLSQPAERAPIPWWQRATVLESRPERSCHAPQA
jgi:NAD(P)-dependent dehydrogenase (short-subunit alcohol dehydrogenase family)